MDPTGAGETAARLPGLWPDAASVVALTQPLSGLTWPVLRRDAAALLLLLGHGAGVAHAPDFPTRPDLGAALLPALRSTLVLLEQGEGPWLDWRRPETLPVYRCALLTAHLARALAALSGRCDPDVGWVGGLLAPLGWFAVAAASPEAVADCLSHREYANDPLGTQEMLWGLDHAEVARRLGRRWLLPDWLRLTVGHLGVPVSMAAELGADPYLFAAVQAAASLAESGGTGLGLAPGVDVDEALTRLGLTRADLGRAEARVGEADLGEAFADDRVDPRTLPYLPGLVKGALEHAQRRGEVNRTLERDVDRLHRLLARTRAAEEERLKAAKLAALAEFAAGASHEINNPLAVIFGQGQYLLQGETDEKRRQSLGSIIRQVQRVNGILNDLMQFARPGRPDLRPVPVHALLRAVVDQLNPLAESRGVRLEWDAGAPGVFVEADLRQVQSALGCLARNAVEAAPAGGWVRVAAERRPDGFVALVVDDNGPGPGPGDRQHMFDPFYSGRSAGRGRGLGLPTAWRLAREHGGDVRFVPLVDGPTRFVLTLPEPAAPDRLTA